MTRARRDEGAVLPLVLVGTFVMSMIIVAVATYVSADLRYGQVVEARADRLAAADGGMRFAIEKLRNRQSLCTTNLGISGNTVVFPPLINGAATTVTCKRVGGQMTDAQGWGVVLTGEGVPGGQSLFITQGGGGSTNSMKTFSGPFYIADPNRMSLGANALLKDGDLWYSSPDCASSAFVPPNRLIFEPADLRGPICEQRSWTQMFTPPTVAGPPTSPVDLPYVDTSTGCRVFRPGKYTSLPLAKDNYFVAGDYYLENVPVALDKQTLIAGYPMNGGDSPKLVNAACQNAQDADRSANQTLGVTNGGAIFYLGGSSSFYVGNQAGLEIFRRKTGNAYVAVYALDGTGAGYVASTKSWGDPIIDTKQGSNNDMAIHGLVWAPSGFVHLENITNAANGQLLGGVVAARLEAQASASISAFLIGIEGGPASARLLLTATATKDGQSTVVKAVVEFRPDDRALAINSWRVV